MLRKVFKTGFLLAATLGLLAALVGLSITSLEDRVSTSLRNWTQQQLNSYLFSVSQKTASQTLTTLDKTLLHAGALAGLGVSYHSYPEAARLLYHYLYGDGKDLELSTEYFKQSHYLKNTIAHYGEGTHGPIALNQNEDWRLSLTLNPFFLAIKGNQIRIFHPNIEFTSGTDTTTHTVVPIGLLRLKVFDNIISALRPTSFYVYAEWLNR